MKGSLTSGALPALLRAVYVGRKTGVLHFTRDQDLRSIRVRQGHILSAQSSVPHEHLGEVLVRNELLTADDLARAGARKRATGKRLGETLQEMGLIEPEHLEEALALHVREVLLHVFSWNRGEYRLEELPGEAFRDEPTLKLSTGEMILETVRLLHNAEVVRAALGSTDRVLALSTDPLLRFQKVTLSPTDGYVLSRVDGMMKARDIIEMIPLPQEEVEKSLYGLLCTGIIEFAPAAARSAPEPRRQVSPPSVGTPAAPPAPPAANAAHEAEARRKDEEARAKEIEGRRKEILDAFDGLKAKNHFEVLGIPRASSETQVKEAYFQLARRFHPDTHHDPAMDDLGPKLEAVFIRLGEAYEVLRSPRTRGSYEADLAARAPRFPRPGGEPATRPPDSPAATPPEARPAPPPDRPREPHRAVEEMIAAEKHMEQGKYWDAIQLLEHAVQLLEGKNLTRARVALGRSYAKNPNWAKQAETILKTAIAADPKSADAQMVLGELYASQGLRSRAASAFRRVLELQPDREDAASALAALGPDEPSGDAKDDGGFLKKIFGKR